MCSMDLDLQNQLRFGLPGINSYLHQSCRTIQMSKHVCSSQNSISCLVFLILEYQRWLAQGSQQINQFITKFVTNLNKMHGASCQVLNPPHSRSLPLAATSKPGPHDQDVQRRTCELSPGLPLLLWRACPPAQHTVAACGHARPADGCKHVYATSHKCILEFSLCTASK